MLILCLWVLLFLTTITVFSGATAGQQIVASGRIEERMTLYDLAYSGVIMAVDLVAFSEDRDVTPGADSLNDYWANDPDLFKDREMGNGQMALQYEYTDNVTNRTGSQFGIIDENRKININYAGKNILTRLLTKVAHLDKSRASGLARNIVDWRDENNIVSSEDPGGYAISEDFDYEQSGCGYTPRNSAFITPEELLLVHGMDTEIFLAIRDYITVFGNGSININTVSMPVLVSLGLDGAIASKVLAFRSGADMTEGTFDDHIFYNELNILGDVFGNCPLSDAEKVQVAKVVASGIFDVESTTFSAQCISTMPMSQSFGKAVCIFDREDGTIQYWGFRIENTS